MIAFGLIREAFSFTHPCSSQGSYLKIEAMSNQVKTASEEIMISSKKTQINIFISPNNAQDTFNVFWNGGVSIFAHIAPMILPFPPYLLLKSDL